MTLDEAIRHCINEVYLNQMRGCDECASEHEQLAEWLNELKEKRIKVVEQESRINDLEAEVNAELAKRSEAYEKLWSAYAKIEELILKMSERS